MIIAGRSWGGYLALLAAGRQPELWSLGIATMPVADWVSAYEDELAATQEHDRALFGGSPAELPEFYAERSPITFVGRVRVPLLLVISSNDPHSPRRQIDNYVERLAATGKTFEIHECEVGHAARSIADRLAIQSAQLEFAMRHVTDHPTPTQISDPLSTQSMRGDR
jgi:dipeptidyl aminopeptidase/acylaminoacyl peptidase